jgi:hypothetical protein
MHGQPHIRFVAIGSTTVTVGTSVAIKMVLIFAPKQSKMYMSNILYFLSDFN